MPKGASIKKRPVDRVVIGLDPRKREAVFLAVVFGLLQKRRENQRRLLTPVDLIDDLDIVAKNLVGMVGEVFLVAVYEFQQGKKRGKIVVVVIDAIERSLELDAQVRYGENDHGGFIELIILRQFV